MSNRRRRVFLTSAAIVALVFLAGCSAPDQADESPSGSTGSAPDQDWNLDKAGIMALYDSYVQSLPGRYPAVTSFPEVAFVRFVTAQEWAQTQADCLTAAGVGAHVGSQNGLVLDQVPSAQNEAVQVAAYVCDVSYPIDPRTQLELPVVRAELQYRYWVRTVAPCVAALGYQLSDPPSLQTWLEQYYGGGKPWDPYVEPFEQASPGNQADVLDELYRECPRDAPDIYPTIGD
jgi:hypothetical protein